MYPLRAVYHRRGAHHMLAVMNILHRAQLMREGGESRSEGAVSETERDDNSSPAAGPRTLQLPSVLFCSF